MQWLIPHIASSNRATSVWASREFLYDSDNDLLYYGDGATLGGVSLATAAGGGGAVSGTNGSFTFNTLTFGALNGVTFYTSNGSLVASYNSTQFQQSSLMTNYLGTTYTSHTHSQYINTSQSSLFEQTSLMTNYLGTAATQSFRFTSNNSQLLFTSQSSLFQATSDNSLSLGTSYTSHTHSQYINVSDSSLFQQTSNTSNITASALNTSQSSLFQQTSLMTNYLGTNATQSFRFTSDNSQLLFTSQSSLFQLTADNSLSLGTTYTSHTHSQYVNTSQTSVFQQTSLMSNYLGTTASIDNLADVVISSATLNQILRYNGANWINADLGGGVGAGNGVVLYFDETPSGISTYKTIAPSPDADPESDQFVVVNNNTLLIYGYANPVAIGRTTIDSGAWDFNIYTYVSNTTPTSTLIFEVYSRTSGGTETLLFSVESDPISFTAVQLMNFTTVQPAYSVNATDYLVVKVYGKTTAAINIDVHFVHSGTDHYSHIHTPLAPLHNDLGGLQGGASNEYFHLNSNDYLNRNVSATSVYQLVANSSNSLGTTYTSHTHSQYINTSQSSLFQQTSLMSDYLGSAATQSFRFTSNDSQLLFTSQSSLFQQVSATSAITSNAFPSAQTTKFAGTGTTAAGTNISLSMTLNSLGLNLAASVNSAGGGIAARNFYNPYGDLMMVAGQVGQGTLNLNPNVMPAMTFDRVLMPINNTNATNSSGSHTLSFWVGIYTLNVSTLSLLTSNSASYAMTFSGTVGSYSLYSGMRHVSVPMSTSLSEGRYFIGVLSRTTSGGANGSYSQYQVSNLATNFLGIFGSSHNTTYQFQPGLGVYSATTNAIPGTIPISQVRGSDSNAFRPPIVIFANSTL
jgi:hypothetical protein